jgi:molybdopterin converting factor small subunit
MAVVKFTRHLVRYFPTLTDTVTAEGSTVAAVVAALNVQYPGLADYVVDERGALRKHVNIFLNQELIQDRHTLSDLVQPDDKLYIFQALSGG